MTWGKLQGVALRLGLWLLIGLVNIPQPNQVNSPDPVKLIRFSPWELVNAVAWSANGDFLAISAGNRVFIYSTVSWERLAILPAGGFAQGLVFSPDGQWLAAASRDGSVRAWKVASALSDTRSKDSSLAPDWSVFAHRKGANCLAFSPSGDLLASGGNDAMAKVWVVGENKVIQAYIGGTFSVPNIAFSPDGSNLAILNGDLIRLREVESGRITGTIQAPKPLFSIAYSPDGKILAASDSDNGIYLWDPSQAFKSGNQKYPAPVEINTHSGESGSLRALVWKLAFSPDGKILASAGGDGTVRFWDPGAAQLIRTFTGHTKAVTSLAFNPDGSLLASGGLDGIVRIWPVHP